MSEFSERVKAARIAKGLSQGSLAKALGVTRPAVSKWETGAVPENHRIESIAQILGVDPAWLSGFGEDIPIKRTASEASPEAALMAAAMLDWNLAMKTGAMARECPEFQALNDTEKMEVLKRVYILGVREPAKLNPAAISAISLSV